MSLKNLAKCACAAYENFLERYAVVSYTTYMGLIAIGLSFDNPGCPSSKET